mgnify:CR=1 FL=1
MSKLYIKIMAFICVIVSLFSFVEPLSVKAMPTNSEYEVDYVFKTEDGISIQQKVYKINDYENYYFQDYVDDCDGGKTNTYRLYEKDSGKPSSIGDSYGNIVLFNDDIYLMKNGICIVKQFYYIGKGDDDCEYWLYFGDDGKMVKDTVINGAIELDKGGFFDYRQSDLYKRTLDLFTQEETERARWINDDEDIRKQYAKKGYSKKQINKMINKKVTDYVKESVKNYSPNIDDVTDILNKKMTSKLGKWVKIEDYVAHKPLFSADGHFVEDKKGQHRYWANSLLKNTALIPSSSVLNYQKFLEGYLYLPDDKYDWTSTLIAKNEYLNDILVEIDGDYYYFNEKGYAEKNKWVSLDEENYFDGTGKQVTDDWVAKDGELYRLDKYGSIMRNSWVNEEEGNTYLSYDGTIYYAAKDKEFEIREKINEFARRPSAGTQVGICSKFAAMLVDYMFGENAKGTKYTYDWDKIKVGDTISDVDHIFVVMAKDKYHILAAESNWGWDLTEHYGRVALDKVELDELSKKGKMKYTFTTYYSAAKKAIKDFKPQKVKLSAKSSSNMVTIKLNKSKGAVGYCIYMSNSKDGDYKLIKTIKAEDELKYTAKNLSSGDYYFKARAYRIINNKKVWGEYSSIVKCNIGPEAN